MPREQVQHACRRCREKRTKCDGKDPCQRCRASGSDCEYHHSRWESKSELRAEIARLTKSNDQRGNLLQSMASESQIVLEPTPPDTLPYAADSWRTDESMVDVEDRSSSDFLSPPGPSHNSNSNSNSISPPQGTNAPLCFDQLQSWRLCHPPNRRKSPVSNSTILSLPPLPIDAYKSQSHVDTWTRTGWTKAHVRHLFDTVLAWDYLPFTILCKDQLLRDYQDDSDRFCSRALVHAVLALASRLINETDDDDSIRLPSGWLGSKLFVDEAETLLEAGGPTYNLPDAQAMGILACYQLRIGKEARAHELAEACAAAVTELCRQEASPLIRKDEEYWRVRATTYCGAVSLARILRLTTGLIFNLPSHALQEEDVILDEPSLSTILDSHTSEGIPVPGHASNPTTQYDLQHITTKIFQLTEWVYKLIISVRTSGKLDPNDVAVVYTKCLDWYNGLFAIAGHDVGRTPFMLFVHMYYHFCVLCACRPFIPLRQTDSSIHPRDLCAQATQSILSLAQSYDDLFTLRRVSGFVPYFICASGLYSMGMADSGTPMDRVHLRRGSISKPVKPEVVDGEGPGFSSPHVIMSATSHARLLLGKIGSTHPAAVEADRILFNQA